MKKLVAVVAVLAIASMAQGVAFDIVATGTTDTSATVDMTAAFTPVEFDIVVDVTQGTAIPQGLAQVTALNITSDLAGLAVWSYTYEPAYSAGWALTDPPTGGQVINSDSDSPKGILPKDMGGFGANVDPSNTIIGKLKIYNLAAIDTVLVFTLDLSASSASGDQVMNPNPPFNEIYPAVTDSSPIGSTFTLTTTPEPATALFLLAGLGFLRRRR